MNESLSAARTFQKVVLLGSGDRRPQVIPAADNLRPVIERHFEIIGQDFAYESASGFEEADLAIVFGGDGSILRAARWFGNCQIPVLGVNLGKLGFLADIQPEQLEDALTRIAAGNFRLVNHLMMRLELFERGKPVLEDFGLNEAAALGGPPYNIQEVELFVDGELATKYVCDGLIVSTPIGSTAHNLSAGGPIVRKDLQAFVISPISPHTLTVRPVVDTAERVFEIAVSRPNHSTHLVLDGQVLSSISAEHRIRIQRSENVFQLIEVAGKGYYQTLRRKLGWGGDIQPPDFDDDSR